MLPTEGIPLCGRVVYLLDNIKRCVDNTKTYWSVFFSFGGEYIPVEKGEEAA